jgi:thiamine-phosphate pyrophosphorylase
MAHRQPATPPFVPRLYVTTPRGDLADDLAALVQAADIATVLVRCSDTSDAATLDRIARVAATVQPRGVALLAEGPAVVVARSQADGIHVDQRATGALRSALDLFKPGRVVGAGGLKTRHDAMVAGEAGTDYVMFGEPDAEGRRPSLAALIERVAWWTEVFEVPCVAHAASLDEVEALAKAGAEFVSLGDFVWRERGGAVAAIRAAAERLNVREPAR